MCRRLAAGAGAQATLDRTRYAGSSRGVRTVIPKAAACLFFAALAAPGAAHAGRFVVLPPQVQSAGLRAEAREMQQSGVLQDLADALNAIVVLPRDVGLRFAECGEANAYYDSEAREISMCLELMQSMAETLEGQFEDDDQTTEALAGAFIAVVLHEAGHALVDVLELPITGREEDAVDQLSAWLLIEADDVASVLGAAATYYTDGETGDDEFADEHSLDRQRYFNLVCWAYGSNPSESADLIETWELPAARAEQCEAEYAQLDRSWSRLLGPHLQPDDPAGTAAGTQRDPPATTTPAPPRSTPRTPPRAPGTPIGTVTTQPATERTGRFKPTEGDE
jgi:hypothetical protein